MTAPISPAKLTLVSLADCPPQPWRNGGGETRELLRWPDGDDWLVRVSVADITRDGPFSAFPGVQRWFAVLEGHGVVLGEAADARTLTTRSAPWPFDGASAPACALVQGATRDLNLMLRPAPGGHGGAGMVRVQATPAATPVDAASTLATPRWRGIYTHVPLVLHRSACEPITLPAGTLAWAVDDASDWHAQAPVASTKPATKPAAEPLAAWWLQQ